MAGYLSVRRRPSTPELFASDAGEGSRGEGPCSLEAALVERLEHAEAARRSEEEGVAVIVPQETVRRLKRIAIDAVLPAEDANWLLEFADSLDGEKLPPTERAPSTYPTEVLT